MAPDLLRDSIFGQLVNHVSGGRLLPYADQLPSYKIPEKYLLNRPPTLPEVPSSPDSSNNTVVNSDGIVPLRAASDKDLEKVADAEVDPKKDEVEVYRWLVDWDGPNDPDNPRNWSFKKRVTVSCLIGLLTFSVYIGSAIYTSSIPDLMISFNVSQTVATLGLTLFVLAYGLGPMIISPIQEIPRIGRNPPYILGLFLFALFQMPPLLAKNIETILIFRFAAGFVGSPALATGGATLGDIWAPEKMPYAISAWAIGGVCGPTAGPVIGGFAAAANGWRWPFYELLWISSFAFIVLFLFMPETLGSTILLRRARRLRKLTGNDKLKAQCELDDKKESFAVELGRRIVNAVKISTEPAVGFANLYVGFVYAIFYLWFEAFPLVFTDIYHFNLGVSGLPYLAFVVSAVLTLTFYILYQKYHMFPRMAANPTLPPESRLELAIAAGFFIPASLFIFGWTARPGVPWIAPVIGAALYLPGIYLLFQSILIYIAMSYYEYQASILAGNAFARSTLAAFFPLFGGHFYKVLGLGGGCSLLAGISLVMIPVMGLLWYFGARLRARSKWTSA
ncbi:MFS transporter, DHA1 family, multidrug resistance protein [Pseudohyphozyma bogoriensis]|nr:MFS transporter, DHA1 family, multidrug resistance protein [Pseudohyphozyma bogoriensis]